MNQMIPKNQLHPNNSLGIDLENLNVKELKYIAKEKGIEGYSDMKKSELIECLKQVYYGKYSRT